MGWMISRTATRTATGHKSDLRPPEGNRRSYAEPPKGIEPLTYALRVSGRLVRGDSPKFIIAGQPWFQSFLNCHDPQRTATETATALRAVTRRLGPRADWWSLWEFGPGPAHVPPHELPQDPGTRAAPFRMHSARGCLEWLPLVVRGAETARGVVLGIRSWCHGARVTVCSHEEQGFWTRFVATKIFDTSLAL